MEAIDKAITIPGLHASPDFSDLKQSCQLYNQLSDDASQPPVSEHDLTSLARIFVQHNVQDRIGIHLIHSHYKLHTDSVNLGAYVPELSGYWMKPVEVLNIDLNDVHGHIFALTNSGSLVPYEYRTGPPPDMSDVPAEFFHHVTEYLQSNGLGSLLGLELLEGEINNTSFEFVMGRNMGTLMLEQLKAYSGASTNIYRTTGWLFEDDGVISCKGTTHHSTTNSGTHYVWQDTKMVTKTSSLDEIKLALIDAGIYK